MRQQKREPRAPEGMGEEGGERVGGTVTSLGAPQQPNKKDDISRSNHNHVPKWRLQQT